MESHKKKSVIQEGVEEDIVAEKDQFLEGDEHTDSSEQVKQDMETGERDADTYTKEGTDELLEDGEIDAKEAGFSKGAQARVPDHEESK